MRFNCCLCKLNVSDRTKVICCDHCNEWIHINCNELNDIDYENLKISNDIWYCKLCIKEILFYFSKQTNIDENNSGYSNINTNLLNLLSQINNLTDNDNSEDENLPSCNYQHISYFTNHITKGTKSKGLSLFHLNVGSLPKQVDNFKYLINQLQIEFDFIGITESRLIKGISPTTNTNLNDYVIEHTPTESSAGGALLYISKKYSYQPRSGLNIYKPGHLEPIFVEIILPKRLDIIIGCIYRHPSMDICNFNDHYLNPLLEKLSKENDKKIFL